MRRPSRVARRYAAALFNTARRAGVTDAVQTDLEQIRSLLQTYPQVLEALAAPRIPPERKKAALQGLAAGSVTQDLTRRFVDLMVDHGREAQLPETADAYADLHDEAANVAAADVRVAAPMDDAQTARLKAKLDSITGRNTRLTVTTDPSLVGGLVVRIGDTILDGSVRGYLHQFETQLKNAPLAAISLDDVPSA